MKTKACVLFVSLFTLLNGISDAQRYERRNRFMIGFRGGVNFTHPLVSEHYSVFAPGVHSPHGSVPKNYAGFMQNMGYGGGITASYGIINNLSLVLEALFYQYRFSYSNTYQWSNSNGTQLQMERNFHKRLSYFEAPLMLRYDILARRVSPFIQAGVAPGYLFSAQAGHSTVQQGALPSEAEEHSDIRDESISYNRFHLSAVGGLGLSFYAGKTMFLLGANARYSILQPTSDLHRFQNSSASGALDVQDKYRLLNMELYLQLMFPIGAKCAGMPKFF